MSPEQREALGRLVRDVWTAWARENPVPCERCKGERFVTPVCWRCDDSTDDHECPDPVPCFACGATGKVVKPSWVRPWEQLTEPEREVDRRIGAALYQAGAAGELRAVADVLEQRAGIFVHGLPADARDDEPVQRMDRMVVNELRTVVEALRGRARRSGPATGGGT